MQQLAIGLLAALKAAEAEELVRGMCSLILQPKGEADSIDAEVLKEEAANRDGAAGADVVRPFVIQLFVHGACGFVAVLQRKVADAVNIPVFTSSLLLVPLAYQSLAKGKKVGIVTANSELLTDEYFKAVGWSRDSIPIAVQGIQDTEFVNVLLNDQPSPEKQPTLESMMIDIIEDFLHREPRIGAIVFECTNLPPFSAAVRETFHLPVFDAITLTNFAYQAVAGGRFKGYY